MVFLDWHECLQVSCIIFGWKLTHDEEVILTESHCGSQPFLSDVLPQPLTDELKHPFIDIMCSLNWMLFNTVIT